MKSEVNTAIKDKLLTLITSEDLLKLDNFIKILDVERKKLNLISDNSFQDIWNRHILDSVQLNHYINNIIQNLQKSCIIDIGSGNGFPIIPIILTLNKKNIDYFLCEKSNKKCLYLQNVFNKMNINNIEIYNFDLSVNKILNYISEKNKNYTNIIFTSRAFKTIKETLDIICIENFIQFKKQIVFIFLKGRNLDNEILEAKKFYNFDLKIEKSLTGEGFVVLLRF